MRAAWFALILTFLISLPARALDGKAVRVVDGDTLVLELEGRKEHLRLIGIDTPESSFNERARRVSKKTHESLETMIGQGKLAAAETAKLVHPGDLVRVELDVEPRDRYGRMLGYVYLADGRMLNELIIAAGYAYPLTVPPNVRHQERFLQLFREAREKKWGLWSEGGQGISEGAALKQP